jgi:hypothetical protein
MPTFFQILAALAVTGVWCAGNDYRLLIVGALIGLLPDFLADFLQPWQRWPDVQITPDPLAPCAEVIARGLHISAAKLHPERVAINIRLNPVPAKNGNGFLAYEIDRKGSAHGIVKMGNDTVEINWMSWLPAHELPLEIHDQPVDLRLTRQTDGRLQSEVLPYGHPLGHTLWWLPIMGAGLFAAPEIFGLAIAVFTTHLLLDYLAGAAIMLQWPFNLRIARRSGHDALKICHKTCLAVGIVSLSILGFLIWVENFPAASKLKSIRVMLLTLTLAAVVLKTVHRVFVTATVKSRKKDPIAKI